MLFNPQPNTKTVWCYYFYAACSEKSFLCRTVSVCSLWKKILQVAFIVFKLLLSVTYILFRSPKIFEYSKQSILSNTANLLPLSIQHSYKRNFSVGDTFFLTNYYIILNLFCCMDFQFYFWYNFIFCGDAIVLH